MPRETLLTLDILVLVMLANVPAFACGDGGCNPPPEPPPVVTPEPPDAPERSDPVATPPAVYMPCCARDGTVIWHAPLNINKARAKAFCTATAISNIDAIPACKVWKP